MKHKRLIIVSTFIVFILVLLLDFVWLLKINETEVRLSCEEEVSEELFYSADNTLKELSLGKSYLLLNTGKIEKKLSENPYIAVESVKKEFPNKVVAVISERIEYFSLEYNGKYYYLDKDFILLKVSENEIDREVVPLTMNKISLDFDNFELGKVIDYNSNNLFGNMVKMYSAVPDRFNMIKSISLDAERNRVEFFIATGVCFEFRFAYLPNYSSDEDKAKTDVAMVNSVPEVYDYFTKLGEKEKSSGKIIIYPISTDKVKIEHIENETYA